MIRMQDCIFIISFSVCKILKEGVVVPLHKSLARYVCN
jgi:hypothetical protein